MSARSGESRTSSSTWKRTARRELRRSRRYLVSLMADLSEEELEWVGERESLSCVKWHVAQISRGERQLLTRLIPELGSATSPAMSELLRVSPSSWPSWKIIEDELGVTRKLTEALLQALPDRDGLEQLFLDIVNAEYAEARFVRSLRGELGKADPDEPGGRLVELDTDVDEPPRFFLVGWERRRRSALKTGMASISCLADHRRGRMDKAMERGHELVSCGDYRAALAAFKTAGGFNESADALTYQGWMHSMLGDVDRAEELCRRAIEVDPDFGNPYNDIGTFCLRRRDVQSAIRWFEKAKSATRYEPRHFPYINLGRLYLSLGMPDRALEEFEGALEHDPGNAEVQRAVEEIRQDLGPSG